MQLDLKTDLSSPIPSHWLIWRRSSCESSSRNCRHWQASDDGNGASHSSCCNQADCMRILARIGVYRPRGSKSRAVSASTLLFVRLATTWQWIVNVNLSPAGCHYSPSVAWLLNSHEQESNMRRCSAGIPAMISWQFAAHFLRGNLPAVHNWWNSICTMNASRMWVPVTMSSM